MSYLYHYCNCEKCINILRSHTLRLSDIRKSNDKNELLIFYPRIFNYILDSYRNDSFSFSHFGKSGIDAIIELLNITQEMLDDRIKSGGFSNFTVCFSENGDLLSQVARIC